MNRYVKIKRHKNWFLVYNNGDNDKELSQVMQEKLLRSEVCGLHGENVKPDYINRLIKLAVHNLDYEKISDKYGTILIRPIGSFTLLRGSEVVEEMFDENFPIEDFGSVVICENDRIAEYKWVEYLKERFPNEKIKTINYFDLRSDSEVKKYFEKAKYITFSTTFSNLDWFKKLTKHTENKHKIIGYSHDKDKWKDVLKINNTVEVVNNI